jgi:membrane protease YdiL (CAAX protease family)
MLALWAVLCLCGGLYSSWHGAGGAGFAATLTSFSFYFGVMLFFAARGFSERLSRSFGSGGGYLLGAAAFIAYLIYAFGTNTFTLMRAGAVAGITFIPLLLAATAERSAPGAWQDYVIVAGIWAAVKFSPSNWLWPYPGGHLAHILTVLLALNVALATFVLVRRLSGIGYSIGWGKGWTLYVLGSFFVLGAITIPLGEAMHFIQFAPHWAEWKALPAVSFGILLFTAWPEEFLFRGLLQNMLARSTKSDLAGWWTASMLFGFSHITNLGFPNWRYVLLASIAGLFYGWTWRKTGSIFASSIVHALIDITWHFFFRPV